MRIPDSQIQRQPAEEEEEEVMMAKAESPAVQRKCAECEEEDKLQRMPLNGCGTSLVQTKPEGGGITSHGRHNSGGREPLIGGGLTAASLRSEHGSGRTLPDETRGWMESRFGADFSDVKVHTGDRAIQMSRNLNARAFTHDRDIYFNEGEFGPGTSEGKRLLAHELTHVVQQQSDHALIQKKEGEEEQEEPEGEPGTTEFEEEVVGEPRESRPGIWEGQVERREYIPRADEEPEETIHRSRVGVVYDEQACEIRIPFGVHFEHPSSGNWDTCEDVQENNPRPVPDAMPDDQFNSLKEQYIQQLNEKLNGWYAVRLENCENSCASQNIDITVQARENDSNPDATVVLTNLEGRSCVSGDRVTLYAGGGISDLTLAHEGGHMILGHGDEYRETDPELDRPEERVRLYDWSLMASHHAFGRWALLHRRHFDFAREFVQQIRPACDVHLEELARPLSILIQLSASLGGAYYGGGLGLYLRSGIDFGVPLDRMREWQLLLGVHGQLLARLQGEPLTAFMGGLRLSLERNFDTSTGGLRTGIFGEFGYGRFQSDSESEFYPDEQDGFYSEAGLTLGGSWAPSSGAVTFLEGEVAGGTTLFNFDFNNPENVQWFRAGIRGGINF